MRDSLKGTLVGILVSLLLLTAPGSVLGRGCAVVVRKQAVVVEKKVVAAAVVKKDVVVVEKKADIIALNIPIVPLYTAPSAYGATYTPPGYQSSTDLLLQHLVERMNQLERSLTYPRPPSSLPPDYKKDFPQRMPPADPQYSNGGASNTLSFPNEVKNWCAGCHDASVSKNRGGDFTMIRGDTLVEFTPQQVGDIIDRVTTSDTSKAMPKSGNMNSAQRLRFISSMVHRPDESPPAR